MKGMNGEMGEEEEVKIWFLSLLGKFCGSIKNDNS